MAKKDSGIVIYTTLWCPYCARAKALLDAKGVAYEDIDVGMDPAKHDEMTHLAGGRTSVPQIFIRSRHVGGCDDLYALERAGQLDLLLTSVS